MALTRRVLLKLFALLGVMSASGALPAEKHEQSSRAVSLRALGPFVDTLIPEDATPSATQLGVDRALIDQARTDSNIAMLLVAGCDWLDKVAREQDMEEFSELDQAAREEVLRTSEQSPMQSLPGVFFNSIRQHAFRHYYAQTESWHGLGFSGPPQYRGFPDHAEPPKSPAA
jgi:hypothetical protein